MWGSGGPTFSLSIFPMPSTTSSPSASARGSTGGSFRWLICLLLFLATAVNYIARQILALPKPMPEPFGTAENVTYGYAGLFSVYAFA